MTDVPGLIERLRSAKANGDPKKYLAMVTVDEAHRIADLLASALVQDGLAVPAWQTMDNAPRDRFILLWCAEDNSRWLARWQGDRWYGVDDEGLTREGASIGDPEVVTGWFVDYWQPLPAAPALAEG